MARDYDRVRRDYLMKKDLGEIEKRIIKKLHVDCSFRTDYVERMVDILEAKGYRYGYSGRPCERRVVHNMPYIIIDITNGFYSGSKGRDVAVNWLKACDRLFDQMESKLPTIQDIHKKAAFNKKPKHKHMLVESKDGRKMERVWYTATGRAMGISRMNDDHLHNTILLVDRNIAAGENQVGMNKDLAHLLNELEDERIHRGLHLPLVPLISLEYRKGNHSYV